MTKFAKALHATGLTKEQAAIALHATSHSINAWCSGMRNPKDLTDKITALEQYAAAPSKADMLIKINVRLGLLEDQIKHYKEAIVELGAQGNDMAVHGFQRDLLGAEYQYEFLRDLIRKP